MHFACTSLSILDNFIGHGKLVAFKSVPAVCMGKETATAISSNIVQ